MKQRPKFEWRLKSDDYYLCSVTVDGVEVYEAGGRFPPGGPSENARTRISYEQEIWEEYTEALVP